MCAEVDANLIGAIELSNAQLNRHPGRHKASPAARKSTTGPLTPSLTFQESAQGSQGVFAVNAEPAEVKVVKIEEGASVLGPAVKPEVEQEVKVEPKKPVEGPVSKWTMVDYDDEDSAFPGVRSSFQTSDSVIMQDLQCLFVIPGGLQTMQHRHARSCQTQFCTSPDGSKFHLTVLTRLHNSSFQSMQGCACETHRTQCSNFEP